mmetsp:Transcript_18760/g.45987  ORF Transcript_18760/g.45987 Transcript_18760/m.45987 type:complete len:290 (-) Transcript_18760:235-1104(-)
MEATSPSPRDGGYTLSLLSTVLSAVHTVAIIAFGFLSVSNDLYQTFTREQLTKPDVHNVKSIGNLLHVFATKPSSPFQTFLLMLSILYYSIDTVILVYLISKASLKAISKKYPEGFPGSWSRNRAGLILIWTSWSTRRDIGFIVHHLTCLWGLVMSVLNKQDATLILIGLLIGETSNPPRIAVTLSNLLGIEPNGNAGHRAGSGNNRASATGRLFLPFFKLSPRTKDTLSSWHHTMFIATRVLLARYVAVISSHAKLWSTLGSAILLLILSFAAIAMVAKKQSNTAFIV